MSSSQYIDVLPVVEQWLSKQESTITKFWLYAEWRMWARFDLYVAIDKALSGQATVNHSNEDWWTDGKEDVDITVEPHDDKLKPVAIRIRVERVSENCGSFETFAEHYSQDWSKLKGLEGKDGCGSRVLLLGLSSTLVPDGMDEFKVEPKPQLAVEGEINLWVTEIDVPEEK